MNDDCAHEKVEPAICDQTLGVRCLDCGLLLGVCWGDEHFSEELWNRACETDKTANPCDRNRFDYCALCGEEFVPC